jgi:hypothetical protein
VQGVTPVQAQLMRNGPATVFRSAGVVREAAGRASSARSPDRVPHSRTDDAPAVPARLPPPGRCVPLCIGRVEATLGRDDVLNNL